MPGTRREADRRDRREGQREGERGGVRKAEGEGARERRKGASFPEQQCPVLTS